MKYKVIKRGIPGVVGGGEQKYYASPVYGGEIDLKALGGKLSAQSTVTKTDAVAVLTGMVDLIADELKDGKIVRLGDLGSFRISISSQGEETVEQVTSRSIKKSKVLFRPDQEFQNSLVGLSFEKAKNIQVNPEEREDTDSSAPDRAL